VIGYKFFNYSGKFWRNNQGGIMPISQLHKKSQFTSLQAKDLLKKKSAFFVRWEEGFDCCIDEYWWHIIKENNANLLSHSKNTRNQIRKGQKLFICKIVNRDFLLKYGYIVYENACKRYETHENVFSKQEFNKAIKNLPYLTEFWGLFDKETGGLEAFSENFIYNKTCLYQTMWFTSYALKGYASYVLFFEMNKYYLDEMQFKYISNGSRNISHKTEIHDFLQRKFGFRKAFTKLNILYAPWLGFLIRISYPLRGVVFKIPLKIFNKASILLKQEEIIRSYVK
jgi:hypothetical protein